MKQRAVILVSLSFALFSCDLACTHMNGEKTEMSSVAPTTTDVTDAWAGSRPWHAPDFSHQEKALGYTADSFVATPALRERVDFWKRVYSEIGSQEGYIHDIEEPFAVYQLISLKDIYADPNMTPGQKEKAVDSRLDEAKKKIASEKNIPEERIRFQRGLKDRFQRAVYVSGRYIEEFERIFAEQGLPKELTRLIFVESSFNVLARSKVGASGLWQIMPSIARSHRMISNDIDQRNDPYEATLMAAKILKDNYQMLGSWPLAVTAYNHGPTGMRKLVEHYQTGDLSELIRIGSARRSFAFASKNFYASFLAALEVEKDANKYFTPTLWSTPLNYTKVTLTKRLSHEEMLGLFKGDEIQFTQWNPHFVNSPHRRATRITPYVYIPVAIPPATSGTDDVATSNDKNEEGKQKPTLRIPASVIYN